MKTFKNLFAILLLLCSTVATAHDFEVGGIFYNITSSTEKTVEVTYKGDSYSAYYNEYTGDVTVPSTIAYNGETYSVTSIGSDAFFACSGLTSIEIPGSVTSIGYRAFYYCRGLTSIEIPGSVTSIGEMAFRDCSGLTSVTIGDGVTSIGEYAFSGCSGLTSIEIPGSVTSIGGSAFSGCSSLTSVTIGDGVTSIGNMAFYACSGVTSIEIPGSVTSIGGSAFEWCCSLTSIEIPGSVTSIGDYAFRGCSGLTSVTIGDGVTSIGYRVFYYCSGLTSIVIPDGVTSIGMEAFSGCSGLTSIEIPGSVTSIRNNAFDGCSMPMAFYVESGTPAALGTNALPSNAAIVVPEQALELYRNADGWSSYAASITGDVRGKRAVEVNALATGSALRTAIGDEQTADVVELKVKGTINSYDAIVLRTKMLLLRKLDLSEATIVASDFPYYDIYCTADNEIGAYMFYDTDINEILLPGSVTSIGYCAFSYCEGLTSIKIPDGVTSIGESAFEYCSGLKSIKLPKSLKKVSSNTFYNCDKLKSVVIPDGVTEVGNGAFRYCSSLTNVIMPPTVKVIGSYAFNNCGSSLEEIRIPSSVTSIGGSAFSGCDNLKRVYTYTMEPTEITESTFPNAASSTLYAPTQARENYYYAKGWSGFLNFQFFDEPYEYFYVNNDFVINDGTGYIDGTDGNNPDADINAGGGFIVEGEQGDDEDPNQSLGDVNVGSDGEGNSGSIIADNNLQIDSLHIRIKVKGGRWYFFAFPFDIPFKNISMENGSDYVFRYYDGWERAQNGNGGWKDINENHLKAARGYIFQCSANDVLVLSIENLRVKKEDKFNELMAYVSEKLNDASWNFTGNPYLGYYDLSDLDYTAPVTVWDGTKYIAIRPGDDDYHFAPYEAFFVQKPEGKDAVGFSGDEQMTKIQSDAKKEKQSAARRARGVNPERLLINLVLGNDDVDDRTRVVFNGKQTHNYETACDAAKFATTGVPQVYTIDDEGVRYAINERPLGNGVVRVGYSVAEAGRYTIAAQRMDVEVAVKDNRTGKVHNLNEGEYVFSSEAGTFEDRFEIVLSTGAADGTTGIDEVEGENGNAENIYDVQGRSVKRAGKGIYIVDGEKVLIK